MDRPYVYQDYCQGGNGEVHAAVRFSQVRAEDLGEAVRVGAGICFRCTFDYAIFDELQSSSSMFNKSLIGKVVHAERCLLVFGSGVDGLVGTPREFSGNGLQIRIGDGLFGPS